MGNSKSSARDTLHERLLSKESLLRSEQFSFRSVGHHGVSVDAKAIAYCGDQGILAVSTASGSIKLYGGNRLEVMLHNPTSNDSQSVLLSVIHMKFTANQRLISVYSDSSIRIYDYMAPASNNYLIAEISSRWTTRIVVCVECMPFTPQYPFFYVATDDGVVHVFHEITGRRCNNYTIEREDVVSSLSSGEGVDTQSSITALASNPHNCNQILIAFEGLSSVYLWDVLKRKMIREYIASAKSQSKNLSWNAGNSVSAISWHKSGKRFVSAYTRGGFAFFRVDKARGLLRIVENTAEESICRYVYWISAPSHSEHANLAGAILYTTICNKKKEEIVDTASIRQLKILHPPSEMSPEDALTNLVKGEVLMWTSTSLDSIDQAEIVDIAVNDAQIASSQQVAPFSAILLSGNPLDGYPPCLSVQPLPGFIRLKESNKEEWDWKPQTLIKPCYLNSLVEPSFEHAPDMDLMRTNPLCVVSAARDSEANFIDQLRKVWEIKLLRQREKDGLSDRFQGEIDEIYTWPINGGTMTIPLLYTFDSHSNGQFSPTQTLLITSLSSQVVQLWQLVAPADASSKGSIDPLFALHIKEAVDIQMEDVEGLNVSALALCTDSGFMAIGFANGKIVLLDFVSVDSGAADGGGLSEAIKDSQPAGDASVKGDIGFCLRFISSVSTKPIKLIQLVTAYDCMIIQDTEGSIFLYNIASQSFVALAASSSGDLPRRSGAFLFTELVQVTDIPDLAGDKAIEATATNLPLELMLASKLKQWSPQSSKKSSPANQTRKTLQRFEGQTARSHYGTMPILFVGRDHGKFEMFYMKTMTKIAEFAIDDVDAGIPSFISLVTAEGKPVTVPGKINYVSQDAIADTEEIMAAADEEELDQKKIEEREYTRAILREILGCEAFEQKVTGAPITARNIIRTRAGTGSLGLKLHDNIFSHATVKGIAPGHAMTQILEDIGIKPGLSIIEINHVNVENLLRDEICALLGRLQDRTKDLAFGQCRDGMNEASEQAAHHQDPSELPMRFIICTCGKSIHLFQAELPKASELAMGPPEVVTQPLATATLPSTIILTSIIRVPIMQKTPQIEHCLVVLDQTRHLYILNLLSLKVARDIDCWALGNILDGAELHCTYDGELIVIKNRKEIERFSLFSAAFSEATSLQRRCIRTRIFDPARQPSKCEQHRSIECLSPGKKSSTGKSGSALADAGKLLKKFIGNSQSSSQEADLMKAFEFTMEGEERRQLLGDRRDDGKANVSDHASAANSIAGTKNTLMQTAERLHERGDKLRDIGLKTEQMKQTSEEFYQSMKAYNDRMANRKWYER